MFLITKKVADQLAWSRLRAEIGMCQELCSIYDKELKPYLMLIGRMGIMNLICRLEDLDKAGFDAKEIYGKWAKGAKYYAPWCVMKKELVLKYDEFVSWTKSPFLDSGYPWGVLTLGGLMRAYAELTEEIKKAGIDKRELKFIEKYKKLDKAIAPVDIHRTFGGDEKWSAADIDNIKDWVRYQRLIEEEGRLSWQRNLIKHYGYDLFKKDQIKAKKDSDGKTTFVSKVEVIEQKKNLVPSKDRIRYQRDILGSRNDAQKEYLDRLSTLFPPWTLSGRKIWQTGLRDRISLIGDFHGLARGATISGTTSDHAYSFFHICEMITGLEPDSPTCNMLTISSDIKRKGNEWRIPTEKELRGALSVVMNKKGDGFGRIVRLALLIPVIQMGIEMHHSVHEMASVLGLNDIINWHVGYYDSLYMTTKELQALEQQYLKKWNKQALKKDGKGKASSPELLKSKKSVKSASTLNSVESKVKKALTTATTKVSHGFFKTLDPFVVKEMKDDEIAGCVVEKKEIKDHKKLALLDQELVKKLNVAVKDGWIKDDGIPNEYLNWHIRDLRYKNTSNPKELKTISKTKDAVMLSRLNTILPLTSKDLKSNNDKIWSRYTTAWKYWRKK